MVERLVSDFRCVTPDLRGFGRSQLPASSFTLSDHADDVVFLIEALGLERYVLVGHSMGAKIALLVASRRPTGLQSIVLVAPSPPTPEPIEEDERTRLRAGQGQRDDARVTLDKIITQPLSSSVLERTLQDMVEASRSAWLAWLDEGSRADISGEMFSIDVPVYVLAGEADPVIPLSAVRRTLERFREGGLVVVPHAGHLVPLEAPLRTAEVIRAVGSAAGRDSLFDDTARREKPPVI